MVYTLFITTWITFFIQNHQVLIHKIEQINAERDVKLQSASYECKHRLLLLGGCMHRVIKP